MIIKLCLALCLALTVGVGHAAASEKFATAADLAQVQQQLQTQGQELAIHKHTLQISLESADKRLADFATLASMQSTHTAWVGYLITVLIFGAGFITYFSATARAEKEARDAVKLWFDQNTKQLRDEVQQLQQKVDKAKDAISNLEGDVKHHATQSKKSMSEIVDKVSSYMQSQSLDKTQAWSASRLADPETTQLVQQASDELKGKAEKEFTANEHYVRGASLYASGNFQGALASFESAIKAALDAPAVDQAKYLYSKAVALDALEKYEDAITVYDEIDRGFGREESPGIREVVVRGLVNKGMRLHKQRKFEGAIKVFDSVDKRFGRETALEIREVVISGLVYKGLTREQLGEFELAITVYEDIDQRFDSDASPYIRIAVVNALVNKGIAQGRLNNPAEAISIFETLESRFGDDPLAPIRESVITGLLNKGVALGKQGKFEQEIKVYDEMDRRFGNDASPGIREQVVKGLLNKGSTRGQQEQFAEALMVYDEMDRRFGNDASPGIREQVVKGLLIKGSTLGQQKQVAKALMVYDEMDRRFGSDVAPGVREQVLRGLVNKGVSLGEQGKPEAAIKVFDEIDRRFGSDVTPEICVQVARALNGLGFGQVMLAKEHWLDEPLRQSRLSSAKTVLERAVSMCGPDDRAMFQGNIGYALFLMGQVEAARAPTLDCLKLGGQKAMDAQRGDAKLHRVEPEDVAYEKLLDELWNSLPPSNAC
jgi:tetratricopeptide (TPR) repeat protein